MTYVAYPLNGTSGATVVSGANGISTTSTAGGTLTYQSSAAFEGTTGVRADATTAGTVFCRFLFAGGATNVTAAMSLRWKVPASRPTGGQVAFAAFIDTAGLTVGQLLYSTTGAVLFNDKSNTQTQVLSPVQAAAGLSFRFYMANTVATATTGVVTVKAYSSGTTQAGSTVSLSNANLGTAALKGAHIGVVSAVIMRSEFDTVQFNSGTTTDPGEYTSAPPTVNAGADQSVSLGRTVTLSGSASDSDGTVSTMAWTRVSGPSSPTIGSASSSPGTASATLNATVTPTVAGTYVYQLSATDNGGLTTTDQVTVVVVTTSNPIASGTAAGGYGIVDATSSTAAAAGALTFSISPSTGTTQFATGKFLVPLSPTASTAYTVTVAEAGGGTSTVVVQAPASGTLTAYTGAQVNVALPTPLDPITNGVWGTQINTALTTLQDAVNAVIGYYNNPS